MKGCGRVGVMAWRGVSWRSVAAAAAVGGNGSGVLVVVLVAGWLGGTKRVVRSRPLPPLPVFRR